MAPTATAAANRTKLNSLACGKARAKRSAFAVSWPAMRPSTNAIAALANSSAPVASASSNGCARASGRSMDMPTEMKKKPSNRPSNGSMSACSSWRYSDSDNSTPAMNAPSDGDRPATVASRAVPVTISSATVVKTSGVFAPPMARNSGRSRKRPPIRITAITAAARATSTHGTCSGTLLPASNGTSATSGMNARSWNSRTAKASRPARDVSRSRSASSGRTIAVDDMARPAPITTEDFQAMPAAPASSASTAPVIATWARPRPNTARRMIHRRCGRTSSPIRNSSITTPRLAIEAMASTSVISPSPAGPIAMPASRYPSTLPNPARRVSGTAMVAAASRTTRVVSMRSRGYSDASASGSRVRSSRRRSACAMSRCSACIQPQGPRRRNTANMPAARAGSTSLSSRSPT